MFGQYDRAVELLERGVELADEVGFSGHPLAMRARLANVEILRGNLDVAEAHHQIVAEDPVAASVPWLQAMSLIGQGGDRPPPRAIRAAPSTCWRGPGRCRARRPSRTCGRCCSSLAATSPTRSATATGRWSCRQRRSVPRRASVRRATSPTRSKAAPARSALSDDAERLVLGARGARRCRSPAPRERECDARRANATTSIGRRVDCGRRSATPSSSRRSWPGAARDDERTWSRPSSRCSRASDAGAWRRSDPGQRAVRRLVSGPVFDLLMAADWRWPQPEENPLCRRILYRWGRAAARHPWRMIGVWLVVAVAVLGTRRPTSEARPPTTGRFPAPRRNSAPTYSSRASRRKAASPASVVFADPDGDVTDAEARAAIERHPGRDRRPGRTCSPSPTRSIPPSRR